MTRSALNHTVLVTYHQVANAIGASLSQVSGVQDTVVSLNQVSRAEALEEAKRQAVQAAVQHGARPDSIQVTASLESRHPTVLVSSSPPFGQWPASCLKLSIASLARCRGCRFLLETCGNHHQ